MDRDTDLSSTYKKGRTYWVVFQVGNGEPEPARFDGECFLRIASDSGWIAADISEVYGPCDFRDSVELRELVEEIECMKVNRDDPEDPNFGDFGDHDYGVDGVKIQWYNLVWQLKRYRERNPLDDKRPDVEGR